MKFIRNDPSLKARRRELRRNQTDAEKALWKRVRAKQLCGMKFFRQYSVGLYILDFYCPQMKLAVELDGGQHNQDEDRAYDNARSGYLKKQDIDIMWFWNHEVLQHPDSVLMKIAERVTFSDSVD